MSRFFGQTLVALLAVATVAAQTVCACPSEMKAGEVAEPTARACSGPGECCKKDEPTTNDPSDSTQDRPCERCNLEHRTDQIHPDRHDIGVSAAPFFALATGLPI